MKQHKFLFIGILLSLVLYLVTHFFDVDLFEKLARFVDRHESWELDELIVPIFVFGFFALLNYFLLRRRDAIELEKLKIYKAMLASTHHILNNFLNNMLLFKLTAEDTEGFPEDVLALYDVIIDNATEQIEALSNISTIDDKVILETIRPK